VRYQWEFSDGDTLGPYELTFSSAGTRAARGATWEIDKTSGTYTAKLRILSPTNGVTNSTTASATVTCPVPDLSLSLIDAAPSARWSTGAGAIPFNGSDVDERGFVIIREGLLLEDGVDRRCLETHPRWLNNGWIRGEFTVPEIYQGHRFLADVGFLMPQGEPGTDGVRIKIWYRGDVIYESTKLYDRHLAQINIDMARYVGTSGTFTIDVLANGTSGQDWLCWVNPRIAIR
jgi:hypothetical protein